MTISNILLLCLIIFTHSMSQKSIAIVGGGLSGLSCAYNVLKLGLGYTVSIVDPSLSPLSRSKTENTGSTAAAGLMHPFTPSGGLIWHGLESFQDTINLVNAVEHATGERYVICNYYLFQPLNTLLPLF